MGSDASKTSLGDYNKFAMHRYNQMAHAGAPDVLSHTGLAEHGPAMYGSQQVNANGRYGRISASTVFYKQAHASPAQDSEAFTSGSGEPQINIKRFGPLDFVDKKESKAAQKLFANDTGSSMSLGLSSIDVSLLMLAAMLGALTRRVSQQATTFANGGGHESGLSHVALAPTPVDGILELKMLQSTTKNFGWTQQSSKDSRLMTLCYATDAESKEEFYEKATKPQLKEECSRRSLKVTGTKAQLIERLRKADAGIVEDASPDRPPPLSDDEIDTLLRADATKPALQNALRSRGLKVSGKKEELRERLKEELQSSREDGGRGHSSPEAAPETEAAAEPEAERTVEPQPEEPDSGSEPEAAAEKADLETAKTGQQGRGKGTADKAAAEAKAAAVADKSAPEGLAAWGCDDMLWAQMPLGAKRELTRFARDGKEELARNRLQTMREVVGFVDAADDAPWEKGPWDTAVIAWEADQARQEAEAKAAAKAAKAAAAKAKREAAAAAKAAAEKAEPEAERTVEPKPEEPDSSSEPEAAAEKADLEMAKTGQQGTPDRREAGGRGHSRPEAAPETEAAAEPEAERTVETKPEEPDLGSEPEAAAEKADLETAKTGQQGRGKDRAAR